LFVREVQGILGLTGHVSGLDELVGGAFAGRAGLLHTLLGICSGGRNEDD
jgi:hypothetical protein